MLEMLSKLGNVDNLVSKLIIHLMVLVQMAWNNKGCQTNFLVLQLII